MLVVSMAAATRARTSPTSATSTGPRRSKPTWYLRATDDRMIPPPAQRRMSERIGATVIDAAGSHSIYVSQPNATAELIKQASRQTVPAVA